MRVVVRVIAALVLASGVACGSASGGADATTRRIESQVWSPYCAGRLLVDCTTRQADELRATIEDRARSGQSEAEILAWLRQNYGDEVLARPGPGLAGAFVWLVPAVALIAGAALIAALVRRWSRRPTGDASAPAGTADDPWLTRVREEVERDL